MKRDVTKWAVGDLVEIPATGCRAVLEPWEATTDYLGNRITVRLLSPGNKNAWLAVSNGKRSQATSFSIEDDNLINLTRRETA